MTLSFPSKTETRKATAITANIKSHSVKNWLLKAFIKSRSPLQLVHKKILKMHLRHWSCWLLSQVCGWWRQRSLPGWTLGQSAADQLGQPKGAEVHIICASRPQVVVNPLPPHSQRITCTSVSLTISEGCLEKSLWPCSPNSLWTTIR